MDSKCMQYATVEANALVEPWTEPIMPSPHISDSNNCAVPHASCEER